MRPIPDGLFTKEVLYILKEEANYRTNEVKPFGLSNWQHAYDKELNDLKLDYLMHGILGSKSDQ